MSANFSEILNSSKFAADRTFGNDLNKAFEASKLSHFQDIFKSSEEIWNKKQLTRSEGPQKFSAVSRIFNAATNTSSASTPASTRDYDTNTVPANYDMNSAQAIEGFVNSTVERTRLEAQRNFLNQHVFETNQVLSRRSVPSSQHSQNIKENASSTAMMSSAFKPLDTFTENVFAKKVEEALISGGMEKVLPALKEAVKEMNDPAVEEIWDKVFAICRTTLLEGNMGIDQLRASKQWMRHVVKFSTQFLENQFKLYMETTIEKNLELAQRGGVPGSLPLIEAFLNVAKLNHGKPEDALYGNHPVWCVLFYCLRLGDYTAAAKVATTLSNLPSCSILVSTINNKDVMIDHTVRIKLSAEWHHEERACSDLFKRACYGLFLDFDCMDVNDNIENWIWSKLVSVKFDSQHDLDRFFNLQRLITVEYGEEWFLDEENGGSSILYFSALLLTGQIERSIEILSRSDMPVFATHLAILSYSLKLLVLTDKVSDPLFISDPADPTLCKFNFARVVILYVKRFEMTNVSYALNYCFFLNKLHFDSHPSENGSSLFEACVSRLVYVSGHADAILGKLANDGKRVHGLLDRFEKFINVTDVICRVALDTSLNGDHLTACSIYCLGGRVNEAIKLMNRQLSICILTFSSQTEFSIRLAEKLLKRYQNSRDNTIQTQHLVTLETLIQCYTIFRLYKDDRFEETLIEAEQALVVPFDPDMVSSDVEKFKLVPDEIRNLLPDLCHILMECAVKEYERFPPRSPAQIKMQKIAKAILLYSAMIPFRFPTAVNSKLLQLQAHVC